MDKTFMYLMVGAAIGVWAKNAFSLDADATQGGDDIVTAIPAFGPVHKTVQNPAGLSAGIYLVPAAAAVAVHQFM